MIVVDTSALMAIVVREPPAPACIKALEAEADVLVSAGTMAEALIVATRRRVADEMAQLIDKLDLQIVPVTAVSVRRIGGAYESWGKDIHPAGLNFGDCFAYACARHAGLPLLYKGDDFPQTDIETA